MATFTANQKIAQFLSIYRRTSSGATTFLEELQNEAVNKSESVSVGGYPISSVSVAGNSTSHESSSGINPLSFSDLAIEGIRLHAAAIEAGATDDASIFAYFMTSLRPIRRVSANFVGLRYEGGAAR